MSGGVGCGVVLAALALGVAGAEATPAVLSTTGSGHSAGVTVDASGNLQAVWADVNPAVADTNSNLEYRYCRIAPGASACNLTHVWDFPAPYGYGGGRAYVFSQGSRITVAVAVNTAGGDHEYFMSSTDDGATFGAPFSATQTSEGFDNDEYSNGSVVLGVGGSAALAAVYNGYTLGAYDGLTWGDSTGSLVSGTIGGLAAMALDTDGRPVAVVQVGGTLKYTKFTGPSFSPSALTNLSNWSSGRPAGIPASEGASGAPSLASGARGLFLTLEGNQHYYHFDTASATWGASSLPMVPATRLAEDPQGRLYGFGSDFNSAGVNCVSETDTGGANPTPLATLPGNLNPIYSRFALPPASATGAWLVGGSYDSKVVAVPLSDQTPSSSCSDQPTSTGTTTTPTATTTTPTTTTTTSTSGSPGVGLVMIRGSFTIHPDGSMSFGFSCPPASSSCHGSAVVTVTVGPRGEVINAARSAHRASAKRKLTIANAGFTVGAGRHATVKLRLNAAGRKLIRKHPKLKASFAVTSRVGTGPRHTVKKVVTLKRARR